MLTSFKENTYYIDKTLLIKEWLEHGAYVTVITRPDGFGKTTNLSMMAEFFDITKDSKALFKGTQIMETEYVTQLNQYPVLFISFTNVKGNKKEMILEIKKIILNLFERYAYVFKNLHMFDEHKYPHLLKHLKSSKESLSEIYFSITFLMKYMEEYYHKEVMVFIDDFDVPFIESYQNHCMKEVGEALYYMLYTVLKTSDHLERGFLAGKYSVLYGDAILGGLNNLVTDTVLNQHYNCYFGFNEQESKEILEYYGLCLNEEIKEMYGGYKIGGKEMFKISSLIKYVQSKQLIFYDHTVDKFIKFLLKERKQWIENELDKLFQKDALGTSVSLRIDLEEISTRQLWGVLVSAGYVVFDEVLDLYWEYYRLKTPNKEERTKCMNLIKEIAG